MAAKDELLNIFTVTEKTLLERTVNTPHSIERELVKGNFLLVRGDLVRSDFDHSNFFQS